MLTRGKVLTFGPGQLPGAYAHLGRAPYFGLSPEDSTRPSGAKEGDQGLPWSPLHSRGQLIDGKFRLERTLGRGGMAVVVLAEDISLYRHVAIKFLGKDLVSDPDWRERFVVEARNMARVRHENVAQIFSYGIHEGWPYFVMEFVAGTTLGSWLRSHLLPEVTAVASIVRSIASGLTAIHRAGLVHHDVKPSNVLVEEHGRVVVTDLGLSRTTSGPGFADGPAGTPRYMAPEQLHGVTLPPSLVERTDVYQLGLTAFELLVGHVPFGASSAERDADTAVPCPSMFRHDLSEAIDRAVLTAIHEDPSWRYPSPEAFSEALNAAVGVRLASRPPGPHRGPR